MALSKEEQARELAGLVGITISDEELSEVTNRFHSLVQELERLKELDLTNVQPVILFPEEEA